MLLSRVAKKAARDRQEQLRIWETVRIEKLQNGLPENHAGVEGAI